MIGKGGDEVRLQWARRDGNVGYGDVKVGHGGTQQDGDG